MVGFVRLWDLNDGRVCSFVPLRDFKDSRLGNEISKTVGFVLFRRVEWWSKFMKKDYEISMMVGFVQLWDLNDGRFCSFVRLQNFKDCFFFFRYEISKTVGWVMRFQRWSVLFCYEISVLVGFVQLWDLNDGRFFFPLFLYKIS